MSFSGGRCNGGERLLGMVTNLGLQTGESIPESTTNRVYCHRPSWPSAKSLEKVLLQQHHSSCGSWSLPLRRPSLFKTSSNEEFTKPLGKSCCWPACPPLNLALTAVFKCISREGTLTLPEKIRCSTILWFRTGIREHVQE